MRFYTFLILTFIREFEANVIILHHSTTICCGYQPVVHCGVLRQSAEMIEIRGRENLKTGESTYLTIIFFYLNDIIYSIFNIFIPLSLISRFYIICIDAIDLTIIQVAFDKVFQNKIFDLKEEQSKIKINSFII